MKAGGQMPSVGWIVHYYGPIQGAPHKAVGPIAAMVTDVIAFNASVQLTLFPALGCPLDRPAVSGAAAYVLYSEAEPPEPNTWRWPPRV